MENTQTTIDQNLATMGQRIGAVLIDVLIAGVVGLVPLIGWVAGIGYFITRDALPFFDGQSLGKKALNIRAVTEDGRHLTNDWGPAVIRSIVLYIPFFWIVELIVMNGHPQIQRLGDQWAKTKVVNV